jgi:hypothetical protein
VPVRAHIKERGVLFHRFGVLWTPTALFLDSDGTERRRSEGYLPRDEFFAELHLGHARVHFMRKEWAEAEQVYDQIVSRFTRTQAAAEAAYWRGVCRYKRTNDHKALHEVPSAFKRGGVDGGIWARKASIWQPEAVPAVRALDRE